MSQADFNVYDWMDDYDDRKEDSMDTNRNATTTSLSELWVRQNLAKSESELKESLKAYDCLQDKSTLYARGILRMINAKLLPCPFCGTAAMIEELHPKLPNGQDDTLFCVSCFLRECGNKTMDWYPMSAAVRAWNRRIQT